MSLLENIEDLKESFPDEDNFTCAGIEIYFLKNEYRYRRRYFIISSYDLLQYERLSTISAKRCVRSRPGVHDLKTLISQQVSNNLYSTADAFRNVVIQTTVCDVEDDRGHDVMEIKGTNEDLKYLVKHFDPLIREIDLSGHHTVNERPVYQYFNNPTWSEISKYFEYSTKDNLMEYTFKNTDVVGAVDLCNDGQNYYNILQIDYRILYRYRELLDKISIGNEYWNTMWTRIEREFYSSTIGMKYMVVNTKGLINIHPQPAFYTALPFNYVLKESSGVRTMLYGNLEWRDISYIFEGRIKPETGLRGFIQRCF